MTTLLQAGALPYKRDSHGVQFLLVTSQRGRWIIPKGLIDPEESPQETAIREAREEAGVVGSLLPDPVGSYADHKWQHPCWVEIYLLEYAGDCEWWEDKWLRHRRWCGYQEALTLIKKEELRAILTRALERIVQQVSNL